MHDLIYKFLLQSGYPRASVITQPTDVLSSAVEGETTFVIVDTDTVERLAAIAVIGAESAEALMQQAQITANFAKKLGGSQVQGFVIRVDAQATRDGEQVQFYKCWPTNELQQLSARTFPDYDSLKVHHRLRKPAEIATADSDEIVFPEELELPRPRLGWGAYMPSILLFLLVLLDWAANHFLGADYLSTKHAAMITVALGLLSLPALVKFLKRL